MKWLPFVGNSVKKIINPVIWKSQLVKLQKNGHIDSDVVKGHNKPPPQMFFFYIQRMEEISHVGSGYISCACEGSEFEGLSKVVKISLLKSFCAF